MPKKTELMASAGSMTTCYAPARPSGEVYVQGMSETPEGARAAAIAFAGCIPWVDCEKEGWRVIEIRLLVIG